MAQNSAVTVLLLECGDAAEPPRKEVLERQWIFEWHRTHLALALARVEGSAEPGRDAEDKDQGGGYPYDPEALRKEHEGERECSKVQSGCCEH